MSTLDDKIKQSLENFEMPYDSAAWTAFEKQLPPVKGTATGNNLGWKAIVGLSLVVATVASIWLMNTDDKSVSTETAVIVDSENETNKNVAPSSEQTFVSEKEETALITKTTKEQQAVLVAIKKEEKTSPSLEKNPVNTEIEATVVKESKDNTDAPRREEKTLESNQDLKTEELTVNFLPSALQVCAGKEVSFINQSSDKKASMLWDFGDGTTKTETNPNHRYEIAGNYTVTLRGNNNKKEASHSVLVVVNPVPEPSIMRSLKLENYEAIPFYVFSTPLTPTETATWSFTDGSLIEENKAEHLFRNKGQATVTLMVSNNLGCSTSIDKSYDFPKFDLLAPNAFTPNGDGKNETFIPEALVNMGVTFTMNINDGKTGKLVFETSNANEGWNGKLNNIGPTLDKGLYVWTVVLKDSIVKNKVFKGYVNLQP